MAKRTPQGSGRPLSRFASDYFDVERLKKRDGIDRRLQEFAARRPWLLRQDQQKQQEHTQSQSSSSSPEVVTGAPPGSIVDNGLERLQSRIEAADQDRRSLSPEAKRALDESIEICDEYERMKRRIEMMGDELDSFG